MQPACIVGLDPGKALFTAVVHSQQAADSLQGERPREHRKDSLSWRCSRGQEADGIKYRLYKTDLGISRKADLNAALLATPTAKVASSAQFHHICHRMQHTAAAQTHFGDRRHRQLRWRSYIKRRQQAYSAICKEISGGNKDTVVAYRDAKFSSRCCKGNPADLRCHCGGSLGIAVRCVILTSSAQASFAMQARQRWMACLSLL